MLAVAALLVTFTLGQTLAVHYRSGVLDLYPVYWGARAWLTGGNAYDLTQVQPHLVGHLKLLSEVGNVYPMPATLLFLPLAVLPPKAAACLYLVGVFAALLALIRVTRSSSALLLFAPLVIAVVAEQLTVLVFLAQMAALVGVRTGRRWLTAASLVVCALKPTQTALLIAVVLWEDRRNLRTHLGVVVGVFAASLLAQPDWPLRWVHAALARNGFFPGAVHWLWWAAPMALIAWRWGDRVGAAVIGQFALTPMPMRLYAFTPLALDASNGARMWVLATAQAATWLLWSTSPPLAVTVGLLLPRMLVAAPLGRRLWQRRLSMSPQPES